MSDEVLKAVKVRAARTGLREGEVIEAALRQQLGLDVFERLWSQNDMSEEDAMELALEAQNNTRTNRK